MFSSTENIWSGNLTPAHEAAPTLPWEPAPQERKTDYDAYPTASRDDLAKMVNLLATGIPPLESGPEPDGEDNNETEHPVRETDQNDREIQGTGNRDSGYAEGQHPQNEEEPVDDEEQLTWFGSHLCLALHTLLPPEENSPPNNGHEHFTTPNSGSNIEEEMIEVEPWYPLFHSLPHISPTSSLSTSAIVLRDGDDNASHDFALDGPRTTTLLILEQDINATIDEVCSSYRGIRIITPDLRDEREANPYPKPLCPSSRPPLPNGDQRRRSTDSPSTKRWSYIPTGAPERFNTFPRQRRNAVSGPSESVELYDEDGFLNESLLQRRFSTHDSPLADEVARRYSPGPDESYEQSSAVLENADKLRDESEGLDDEAGRYSLDPEAFYRPSATHLTTTNPLRNGIQEGGASADYPAPRYMTEGLMRKELNRRRRGEALRNAALRAEKIMLERKVSSFSWNSGVVEQDVPYSRDIADAEKKRAIAEAKEKSAIAEAKEECRDKKQRQETRLSVRGNYFELQASRIHNRIHSRVVRETIARNSLHDVGDDLNVHEAPLLRRTVSLTVEPIVHSNGIDNEYSVEVARRRIADASNVRRDPIERQESIIEITNSLPEAQATVSERQGAIPQNSWEHVQYSAQMNNDAVNELRIHKTFTQRYAVSTDFEPIADPLGPTIGGGQKRIVGTKELARAPRIEVDPSGMLQPVSANYCSRCNCTHPRRPANAQDSVIMEPCSSKDEKIAEGKCNLMRVHRVAKAQSSAIKKLDVVVDEKIAVGVNAEKDNEDAEGGEKELRWYWPFGRRIRKPALRNVSTDGKKDVKKGELWNWKPKAERRKLSKCPPNAPPAM
ncbi:hypothetical protein BU25DRAFT_418182 [Macroventuria anomochaeta]|uniref:Uncharacterized protein n=1 Tax=Macroventuria anomochaeta TaxID=301207 RepID=A0ACB6SBD1_9PLEO|nr:uncharacterized protein BU25DRAFT_418182 [Macroventuria anomochaeta]KAF2631369.1 hypothetical protein BU25DRAFT_418182 [Macroventuria anomochaeta]